MVSSVFDRAFDLAQHGAWNSGIVHALKSAAAIAGTESAILLVRSPTSVTVIAGYQIPFELDRGWTTSSVANEGFRTPFISNNIPYESDAINPELDRLHFRYFVNVPLSIEIPGGTVCVICGSGHKSGGDTGLNWPALFAMADSLTFQLRLLRFFSDLPPIELARPLSVGDQGEEYDLANGAEAKSVTAEFLLKTLVSKIKVHVRGQDMLVSLRSWRASIKEQQIAALRALKRDCPSALIARIADEICVAGSSLYHVAGFDVVTNVACGHSGSGCLAEKVARAVGERTGVPYAAAFQCLPVSGSSHPRSNIDRPRMKVAHALSGRVLLVDDVITTGSHMLEAAKILRSQGCRVQMIGWIG
jgi:hypothetical protein